MIQDWGYNYLYLRQPNATTRIDLKDHSFRDVQNTPVRDFETSTMEDMTPSWLENGKLLWLCGLDKNGSERKSEADSDGYIVEPFPEHKIEPFGWQDILATLDVCAEKVHATRHCDNEGYDIRSLNMVVVLQDCEKSSYSNGIVMMKK